MDSILERDLTPDSSEVIISEAGDINNILDTNIRSPLANGDNASILGSPSGTAFIFEEAEVASPNITRPVQSSHHSPPESHQPPSEDCDWVAYLLTIRHFDICKHHAHERRKNECTHFCLHCSPNSGSSFCSHCLDVNLHCAKCGNKPIQIRRYMYQNVVNVEDIHANCNVTGIQTYTINNKSAVLLPPKIPPTNANAKPSFNHSCATCNVPLNVMHKFCSLSCKAAINVPLTPAPRHVVAPRRATLTDLMNKCRRRPGSVTVNESVEDASAPGTNCADGPMLALDFNGLKRRKKCSPVRSYFE